MPSPVMRPALLPLTGMLWRLKGLITGWGVAVVVMFALCGAALAQSSPPSLGTMPRALTSPPAALSGVPAMVALRRHVTVEGETVRLSDLFDGVPSEQDKPILRAPELGKTVTLDMAYLTRLAQTEGLNWTPLSQSEQVSLSRASSLISAEEILAAVGRELTQKGMPTTAELEVSPPLTSIPIPAGTTPAIDVYDVTYSRTDGRFGVRVSIRPAQAAPIQLSLNGQAFETIDIPVLATSVTRGQVLESKDIGFTRQRLSSLQGSDVMTDFDQVLGKAARRVMHNGEVFRSRDLERPAMVTKGSIVTMVLKTPMMQLTAQGRALQDGAMGDVIKVQNPRSGKTVLGTVIESRTVAIDSSQSNALQ